MGWVGKIHLHDYPVASDNNFGQVWECSCKGRFLSNGSHWTAEDSKNKFVVEEELAQTEV